ncbi:helix-turn-helix domain-containing protein [Cohnella sp. GCM10012308]|uniref:helix-turn-helix transcriptional regulator n=1 Tax=Cohnella sp. GCM10012308 TaxID=3317329 RepID=UPI0036152586
MQMREVPLDRMMPAVNFANRSSARAGENWGHRIIPDYQLFYVVSGRAEFRAEDRVHTISEGEFVYYGPGCPTFLSVTEPTDFFSLHFDWHRDSPDPVHPGHAVRFVEAGMPCGEIEALTLRGGNLGDAAMPTVASVSGLEQILMRMVREYEQAQIGYAFALRALMMQAIALIFRHLIAGNGRRPKDNRIELAIQAIQGQPGNNWSVAELAGLCGYHPIHFSKLFKEEVGLAPKHYIIGERVRLAKAALLQGEKMSSISLRLGFTSVHYFSHQFKLITGLTPSEFRMNGSAGERS